MTGQEERLEGIDKIIAILEARIKAREEKNRAREEVCLTYRRIAFDGLRMAGFFRLLGDIHFPDDMFQDKTALLQAKLSRTITQSDND